jgi:PAS domain S-box-containing protein
MARDRETIHILLVEGSENHATLIREALESGHIPVKLTVAQNLAEAHACLSESLPHLAIIDLLLPDGNGVELLPTQKEKLAYPVVIMSSQGDEQAAVDAMKAGAVDYVVKSSATLAEMPRIVEKALREWRHITERKQSHEALQESEERFRSFFESAASGMAIIDLEGRVLRVNPTFCRLSGYSEAEVLEMNILEVTHPDDREKTRHLYDDIRVGRRRVVDHEKRYLCKDGSVVWGHATVAGVFGSDGALRYFAANVHDITESKRAQDQIRESQQRLQLVIDYIPQHVFWKDRDSVYIGCNLNFARVAGVERPQDLIGKTDYDLAWKRAEADFFRECDRRVMEADTPELHIIEPQLQADGKQAWLDTNKVPFHDAEGNVVGILGTFEDFTERKRAEEELRAAHRQMQDIIEFLPDATFVIDRNRQVVAWNRALEEKTGVRKEDILGQGDYAYSAALYKTRQPTLIDLIGCSDPEIEAQYNFVEKKGETLFAERFMPNLYGGKGAHVWLKASPLHDPEGNLVGAIESIRDITDRKEAEENLKETNRELDAFVYTVSHDLRSPLTPIIGYADFLRENCSDRLDEQALDCLAEISTSGRKMVALMEDLLTLAKVGQVERPAKPVDVNQLVQGVAEEWGSRILDAGLTMKRESLPALQVTETLLAQIFNNLIGNAVRYAGREGGPIEIGGERSGKMVRFFVRDHGPGIPVEERNRIFEVFFRGATGKMVRGAGVGLAIVQKIARLYGGRAWVEETPGGGCTFCVEMEDAPRP